MLRGGSMGCVVVAARTVAVVVGTWLMLIMLMVPLVVLTALLRTGLLGDLLSAAVGPLWVLALIFGPLVACFVLRRWITGGDRAGSPDGPPPPRSDDQGDFRAPRDPPAPPAPEPPVRQEQPDAKARRRARRNRRQRLRDRRY
ncbi:hypothetical protein [Kitasatospora purpeofusca]|uniref:hypothetical protein n=1 Tax=Kitasatospora purpeofusca TaxID=67352 RepID=UPI0036679BD9